MILKQEYNNKFTKLPTSFDDAHTVIFYIYHTTKVMNDRLAKLSLYLKKAGLASRDIVHH